MTTIAPLTMTAPPTHRPIIAAAQQHLAPASVSSESATPWQMAPSQLNARRPQNPQRSPSNENNGGDLLFITGNNPADFKRRENMTRVRKQAMDSYLQKEGKPKSRSRKQSEENESRGSRTSVGSDQQEPVDAVISKSDALKLIHGQKRQRVIEKSLPTRSTASSGNKHRTPTPDSQTLRISPSLAVVHVLSSAPIVQPMRTGIPLPYDNFPLESLGEPLDPFRTMYQDQAQHPGVSVNRLKFHCSRVFGTKAMGQHWIPTLVKAPHAFLSTLCIASAQLDAINNRPNDSMQTIALRHEVIHLINQNFCDPQSKIDDFNIIAVTQLIASEIISGQATDLDYHEKGIREMIIARGGLKQLGVNGRLASTISWVSLESAILRETNPPAMYANFCRSRSSRNYPNTATIPESPLFAPRGDLHTIERSSQCLPRTLELLKDVRTMLEFFIQETSHSRQNTASLKNLYTTITSYPSISVLQESNVLTPSYWIYETIRICAVIQATAIIKRIPLSEAVRYAAQNESTGAMYSAIHRSDSSDSLISPTTFRHDSPVTSFSTSSPYATSYSGVGSEPNPFAFGPAKPSISSINSSNSISRPSISSFSSSSNCFSRPSITSSASDTSFSFFSPTAPDTSSFNFNFPAPPALAVPTGPNALLTNLRTAIENSNISDCWSDMAGVLLWIGLVAGAASRRSDKVLKKWFAALAMRCGIMLCFEHPEAIHATMVRMGELVSGLGDAGRGAELEKRECNVKRRRL